MKRLSIFLALPLLLAGCKHVTAPLPTGALNSTDAYVNATLQAAQAGLNQYKADVAAGKHSPSAPEKKVVNSLIASYDSAVPVYQTWHTALATNPNLSEPQQLDVLLTAIATDLAQIQTFIAGGN